MSGQTNLGWTRPGPGGRRGCSKGPRRGGGNAECGVGGRTRSAAIADGPPTRTHRETFPILLEGMGGQDRKGSDPLLAPFFRERSSRDLFERGGGGEGGWGSGLNWESRRGAGRRAKGIHFGRAGRAQGPVSDDMSGVCGLKLVGAFENDSRRAAGPPAGDQHHFPSGARPGRKNQTGWHTFRNSQGESTRDPVGGRWKFLQPSNISGMGRP